MARQTFLTFTVDKKYTKSVGFFFAYFACHVAQHSLLVSIITSKSKNDEPTAKKNMMQGKLSGKVQS